MVTKKSNEGWRHCSTQVCIGVKSSARLVSVPASFESSDLSSFRSATASSLRSRSSNERSTSSPDVHVTTANAGRAAWQWSHSASPPTHLLHTHAHITFTGSTGWQRVRGNLSSAKSGDGEAGEGEGLLRLLAGDLAPGASSERNLPTTVWALRKIIINIIIGHCGR
jgi:hypothetical protein